jgi:hypothetical protein
MYYRNLSLRPDIGVCYLFLLNKKKPTGAMQVNEVIFRADIVSSQLFFNANCLQDNEQESEGISQKWSTATNISLYGPHRSRLFERLTFLIVEFEPEMDYYADFGDGNCKRILSRKFHYQYSKTGNYAVTLYTKAGDSMIPLCSSRIHVEGMTLAGALRSISFF